jgi:hypothetical protein
LADSIYAISLHQPWASFIAHGLKGFETRSWSPPRWLIGKRIAIHAAKKTVDADNREWARRLDVADLPLGAMVCTALLAGAYQCGPPRPEDGRVRVIRALPGSFDTTAIMPDEFGDYTDGRWAWLLADVESLRPPIPTRGAQGFWKWADGSADAR